MPVLVCWHLHIDQSICSTNFKYNNNRKKIVSLPKNKKVVKMLNDDFEHDIAASMDDLETIDTITIPPPPTATALTTSKLAKFKRLPEIDENSPTDVSPTSTDLLFRVSTDVMAASMCGNLRKTVLINNSANEILSSSMLNVTPVDDIDIKTDDSMNNNNFTNGKKNDDEASPVLDNNNKNIGSTITTGTRRKFIVTRMDSNALLRPEADNLRNLTAKSNAATISFPCSSATSRAPLSSIFSSNTSFEPHLDKRFFDTSLVRINANSTQSLNVSNNSNDHDNHSIKIDADIWERRKDSNDKHVQLVVSSMSQMISNDIL